MSLHPSPCPTYKCSCTEMLCPQAGGQYPTSWAHCVSLLCCLRLSLKPQELRAAQEYRRLIFPTTVLNQLGRRLPEPPMVRSCNPQANSQGFSEGPKELKPEFLRAVIRPVMHPVTDVHSTMSLSPRSSLLAPASGDHFQSSYCTTVLKR